MFKRYIAQSGISLSPWAFRQQPEYAAQSLAAGNYHNCTTNDTNQIIACLRQLTMSQLLNTGVQSKNLIPYLWGPTSEPDGPGALLTDTPANILKRGKSKHLNWMAGVVRDDSLAVTLGIVYYTLKHFKFFLLYKNHTLNYCFFIF